MIKTMLVDDVYNVIDVLGNAYEFSNQLIDFQEDASIFFGPLHIFIFGDYILNWLNLRVEFDEKAINLLEMDID